MNEGKVVLLESFREMLKGRVPEMLVRGLWELLFQNKSLKNSVSGLLFKTKGI